MDYIKILNEKIYTDIIEYNKSQNNNHIFTHIHNGRCLYPCAMYRNTHNEDKSICYLYDGGLGMGNYIKIIFDKVSQEYKFIGYNPFHKSSTLIYKTKEWDEMFNYVCKYITSDRQISKNEVK